MLIPPPSNKWFLGITSVSPETAFWSVQPFWVPHTQTHKPPTLRVTSVAICRIYAMHAMRPNNTMFHCSAKHLILFRMQLLSHTLLERGMTFCHMMRRFQEQYNTPVRCSVNVNRRPQSGATRRSQAERTAVPRDQTASLSLFRVIVLFSIYGCMSAFVMSSDLTVSKQTRKGA